MKAYLILEDGSVYEGESFGSTKEVISEIVFNTSMTGYLEVLTDPSYAGQAVVMTYPLIGNYGVCYEDMESVRPWADAWVVREVSDLASNFRSEGSIQEFLEENDIPAICGVDTRDLTKRLREHGTMNGMLTTNANFNKEEALARIKEYSVKGVVLASTCKEKYVLKGQGKKVALLDLGAKDNIAISLQKRGCEVTVWPANTSAEEILASNPDGIMLSNGPGNPEDVPQALDMIRGVQGKIPIFGICMGHQLFAMANGAKTYKMKFGHRGFNHAVREIATGRVDFTSQNHGYAVSREDLPEHLIITHEEINDKSVEGVRHRYLPGFSVQFHPDAAPGPHDASYLFDEFIEMMEAFKQAN